MAAVHAAAAPIGVYFAMILNILYFRFLTITSYTVIHCIVLRKPNHLFYRQYQAGLCGSEVILPGITLFLLQS